MVYIGVDGGGTKTAIAAFKDGKLIASAKVGPCNYNFIGIDAATDNIIEGIKALGIPMSDIAAVGVGDPSIDDGVVISPNSATARIIAKLESELEIPVYFRSDAYMTLFALTKGELPAILILSGTGSMGISENAEGKLTVVGGWGRLIGDEGSGYFIALEGIKAALRAADGIAPKTALTNAALEYFAVENPRDLIGVFYGDKPADIAGFSRHVSLCAEAGDTIATAILLEAAKYLALYAQSLIEQSGASVVGVYGSVICNDKIVRKEFERLVLEKYSNVQICEPGISPEEAAAMYAKLQHTKKMI